MRRCCPSSPFAWRLVAQDLPAGHRQHRDHRHCPRSPRPHGSCRPVPAAVAAWDHPALAVLVQGASGVALGGRPGPLPSSKSSSLVVRSRCSSLALVIARPGDMRQSRGLRGGLGPRATRAEGGAGNGDRRQRGRFWRFASVGVGRFARSPRSGTCTLADEQVAGAPSARSDRGEAPRQWWPCRSARRTTSARCMGERPVSASICWRQLNPSATISVSSVAARTAGASTRSPTLIDSS
jgi:hypothetical protein